MNTLIPPGLSAARHEFQRGLLKCLQHDPAGVVQMHGAVAAVADTANSPLWRVILTWLDALTAGDISADYSSFRFCVRIDAQLRELLRGSDEGAEALTRELLQRLGDPPQAPAGGTILSATLYDLYLTEARGLLATLERERALPPTQPMIAAARVLGEISATIGMAPIERLAQALEQALERLSGAAATPDEATQALLDQAIEALRILTETAAKRRQVKDAAQLVAALDRLAPEHGASA